MRTYNAWNVEIGIRTWIVVASTAQAAVLSVIGSSQGTPGLEKADRIQVRRECDVTIPDCAFDLVQADGDLDPEEFMAYLRDAELI